jgi:hypothetical protein
MRIALPIVDTITVPSAAFQSYVLEQLPRGGVDTITGTSYPAAPALVPFYHKSAIPGVTQAATLQWLNPDAFVSAVDPSTGDCNGVANGVDTAENCQFGNLGRNTLRGPNFTWSDLYLTRKFSIHERVAPRVEDQFFNFLNHPNFVLPTAVAGIPGQPATQTGFGALVATTSPPTGLLGVGLGGDNSPRMVAIQLRLEF